FRTTLLGQTGQPKTQIELWIRHAGEVPIRKDGSALGDADVVAPQVPMREALTVGAALLFIAYQERERPIEPLRLCYAERKEWSRVRGDGLPICFVHAVHLRVRFVHLRVGFQAYLRVVHRGDLCQHQFHLLCMPWWRPMGSRQILQDEDGFGLMIFPR